ncbi:hypothetical protein P8605_44675, partial [Streptomyces sp. T-3]|nr:hypothetical protein [Streptomyces sp. T-3]
MSANDQHSPGEPEDRDPWAPPESRAPQDKVELAKPEQPTPDAASTLHSQPTVTSMPGADTPPAGPAS